MFKKRITKYGIGWRDMRRHEDMAEIKQCVLFVLVVCPLMYVFLVLLFCI